ncbi:MAG: iron ABC transporter permease [Chloroflexi bacterium]|nr:iron ABC transporter permease [Chloroflexota bacterium]
MLLVLFMLYPLAAIILQSVFPELYAPTPSLALDLSPLASVFSNPHNYLALFNSFWLGLVTSIIAGLIGTLLAILMTRTDLPAKKVVDICVWIIFFTPSFMLGEAWSVVFLRGGTLDHYVNLPDGFINAFFSPLGVILILSLKNFPLVYISVVPALRWLGSEFEDAARVAGARLWFAWWRINLPLLLPPILAGTFLVFADAISDFGVSATIAHNANVPLIPYQIYANVDTFPVNFPLAAAFSFLLFFAIVAAMLIQARIMRSRSFQVISGRTRPARPIQLGVWKIAAVIFTLVIIFLGFVIPFVTSVLMSLLHAYNLGFTADNWTLDNYTKALTIGSDSFASLVRTFWLALAAATIATLIGFIVAFVVNRTNLTGHRFLGFFTLITLGVPGLILAVGYIFAWNAPYLKYIGIGGKGFRIYGTLWILLAAYVGGHLPRTTQLSAGALEQVGQNILDSARVQGAGIFNLLRSVVAPIMRGNLASTWLLMFTSTMFELAASQLLYPPGQPTLPVEVIALFNTFQVGPGMALSLLCVFIVTILLVLLKVLPSLINGLVTWRLKEEKSAYVLASKELE